MFFFSHFLAHQETKQRSHFTLVSNVSCTFCLKILEVLFFHRLRGCFMSVSGEPWDCWFESPGPPWMYEYDLYSQVKSPVTTLIRTRLRMVGLCFIWSLFFFSQTETCFHVFNISVAVYIKNKQTAVHVPSSNQLVFPWWHAGGAAIRTNELHLSSVRRYRRADVLKKRVFSDRWVLPAVAATVGLMN